MVSGLWDVELEYCPLYLISRLGHCKEYSHKIRSIPEPGMPEPVCKSCGVLQRTASTNIAAIVLNEFSCLNIASQSPTAGKSYPQRNEMDTLHHCSRNMLLRSGVCYSFLLKHLIVNCLSKTWAPTFCLT